MQENLGLHIHMNKNEPQLKPHYIHVLWTQLTKLIGINIIDTNSSQPIMLPEDHQALIEFWTFYLYSLSSRCSIRQSNVYFVSLLIIETLKV